MANAALSLPFVSLTKHPPEVASIGHLNEVSLLFSFRKESFLQLLLPWREKRP